MQKIKKVVSVLAAGTMLASMTAFSANAADEATIAQMQSTLDGMAVEQAEMSAEALAIAQTQEMLAEVQSDSKSFEYPYFNKYVGSNVAQTQHYLAAIPVYGQAFPDTGVGVYFYVNTNILPGSPVSKDNFKIGSGYVNGVQLNTVTSQTDDGERRRILVKFGRTSGSISATSELFSYKLGDEDSMNNAVNSEDHLCQLTASLQAPNSLVLNSNVSGQTFRKCVYARGDVNRDGQVTLDDSEGVLCYLVGTAYASRAENDGGYYDTIAFEMAADFNRDGEIDISDVVAINRRVTGQEGY